MQLSPPVARNSNNRLAHTVVWKGGACGGGSPGPVRLMAQEWVSTPNLKVLTRYFKVKRDAAPILPMYDQ